MKRRDLWLLLFLLLTFTVALGVMRSRVKFSPAVVPYVHPQIISFVAVPRVISRGEQVTLTWNTTGSAMVSIDARPEFQPNGSGEKKTGLPPWGTMTVEPEENTIYVLECEGPAGEVAASASASVRVR